MKTNQQIKSEGLGKRQKSYENYDQTASIIARSCYENRANFIYCGCHGFSCGDRVLCKRCCYNLLAEPALEEFGNTFTGQREVYFIVTSLSREADERKRIIFKDLTKAEMQQIKVQGEFEQGVLADYGIPFSEPWEVLEARIYWNTFAIAIHEFTGRNKPLAWAFGGPELSVRFMPLGVLPHANYVGFSAGLIGDDARALRRIIRQKLRGCRRLGHASAARHFSNIGPPTRSNTMVLSFSWV